MFEEAVSFVFLVIALQEQRFGIIVFSAANFSLLWESGKDLTVALRKIQNSFRIDESDIIVFIWDQKR